MRLSPQQVQVIRRVIRESAGETATVRLFGSRADDNLRGGDIDLLVEIPHPVEGPAWLSAEIAGAISRRLDGRKVDVLITAPNLERFPIHEMAHREGVVL